MRITKDEYIEFECGLFFFVHSCIGVSEVRRKNE